MKIIVSASGTGGHIYPALSVAKNLAEKNHTIIFIGSANKLTKHLVSDKGFKFFSIPMKGWQGRKIISLLIASITFVISLIYSFFLFLILRPNIVLGMGGYVVIPISISARILNIPIVLHEQNCYPGLANRLVAKLAKKIALGFEYGKKYFDPLKTEFTGNPIREEFYILDKFRNKSYFGIPDNYKVVFVFGGSQGAHVINDMVVKSLSEFKDKNIFFIHITGKKDYEYIKKEYEKLNIKSKVYDYFNEIYRAYAVSDCIISRSGALSCSEILASGIPAILIPYRYATDDHQFINASYLEKLKIAKVYREEFLTPEIINEEAVNILNNEEMHFNIKNISKVFAQNRPEIRISKILEIFRKN
jgi:UDP-N-acetylglucosamine--N-acetylmuramyl-(pentapeptide) pyrophosphoryl-undecaprenol N-acetylglucosamine transferase